MLVESDDRPTEKRDRFVSFDFLVFQTSRIDCISNMELISTKFSTSWSTLQTTWTQQKDILFLSWRIFLTEDLSEVSTLDRKKIVMLGQSIRPTHLVPILFISVFSLPGVSDQLTINYEYDQHKILYNF